MFKNMFLTIPLPLAIIDEKGGIVLVNKGFEHLTGYTATNLLGANLRDLCAPYERGRFVFSNLARVSGVMEVEIDLKTKSGRSFMANVTLSPFLHKRKPLLLLVVRDITQRVVQEEKQREDQERYRKLLEERNTLEDQLKRSIKLASVGELAAGIAHEINNPLGIVLGFAQELLEEIPREDPSYESIRIIEQETARCAKVVKNLLDFARLKPPQISEVDIVRLLNSSVSLLLPKIKKNNISVKRYFQKKLPLLNVDPQLMQQVFLNVMINAIQAMPYGGELAVGVRSLTQPATQNGHKGVVVTISDTGHGIEPEYLERVFDPFFTTKGSKGTGLGLSVCQRIVEDHHGRIDIASSPESGTTCSIFLPF
jgi:two-component system NtrC family sensor kinase